MGSAKAITVLWRCCIPKNSGVVRLCEQLMKRTAIEKGYDVAIIRNGPHTSPTESGKRYHITGAVAKRSTKTAYSCHWYLTRPPPPRIPKELPNILNQPNPQLWPMDYAKTGLDDPRTNFKTSRK
ncbi:hypothetical protein C8J55DRAFT_494031 [Lentinula edodes]|uniref:Uncharacterized protein n=1 Tax=Lentinula lateritia TaxID=40482 RepID=A0A9W8ZQI9_9AGAR|nr:hypothetical protein C8J55DRAFT_494031 [Lentinula edodes]